MSTLPMNQGGYSSPVMQDISSQRRLAEKLREQSQESLNGQMVGNHYVPASWTQHLARVLQGYGANKIEGDARKQEGEYNANKSRKLADILAGNKSQQVQDGMTTTSTLPAYEPSQMDRFGSPMQGVERQPQITNTPNMRQESPQEQMQRVQPQVLEYMAQYGNTPEAQYLLGQLNKQDDRAYAKGEKLDDRQYTDTREEKLYNRGRQDKLSDIDAERKYQDIVRADTQGFQVSQQDRQFAQQFKMQKQSQGFAAGQQSRSQQFQAGENQKNREQQVQLSGLKAGANTQVQKTNDAKDVLSILDQAEPLVKTATSSGLGNMIDKSQAFFGGSNQGANDAAQLKALEGNLISKMPKMSGPQSDKDVLMYKQMAGAIGDPTLPVEQKQAAMNAIREINSRYAGVPYEQQSIMPKGEAMPAQDAGYLEWKKRNGKQ